LKCKAPSIDLIIIRALLASIAVWDSTASHLTPFVASFSACAMHSGFAFQSTMAEKLLTENCATWVNYAALVTFRVLACLPPLKPLVLASPPPCTQSSAVAPQPASSANQTPPRIIHSSDTPHVFQRVSALPTAYTSETFLCIQCHAGNCSEGAFAMLRARVWVLGGNNGICGGAMVRGTHTQTHTRGACNAVSHMTRTQRTSSLPPR